MNEDMNKGSWDTINRLMGGAKTKGVIDIKLSAEIRVKDFIKELGVSADYISATINLPRIGAIISYPNPNKKKVTKRYIPLEEERILTRRNPTRTESLRTSIERGLQREGVSEIRIPRPWNAPQPARVVGRWDTWTERALRDRLQVYSNSLAVEQRIFDSLPNNLDNLQTRERIARNLNSLIREIREIEEAIDRSVALSQTNQELNDFEDDIADLDFNEESDNTVTEVEFDSTDFRVTGRPVLNNLGVTGTDPVTAINVGTPEWNISSYNYIIKDPYKVVPEEKKEKTLAEIKHESFLNFNYNYSGNPAIIKGYVYRDKLYTSNEAFNEAISKVPNSRFYKDVRCILKVFSWNVETESVTDKLVYSTRTVTNMAKCSNSKILQDIVPLLVKLRIRDTDLSTEVFGSGKERRNLQSSFIITNEDGYSHKNYIHYWYIEQAKSSKLGVTWFISIVGEDEKKIKFVFKDCEFINPELAGYVPPVDKTMDVGATVKIRVSKISSYNIPNGSNVATILSIKGNPSSKRISKQCRNRRMDIITVKLNNSNRVLTVYAEDLKFLEKSNKEYVTEEKPKVKSIYSDIIERAIEDNFRRSAQDFISTNNF